MKVCGYLDVEPVEDIPGVLQRVVVGDREGAPRFVMRVFEVGPGRSTPLHSHWWEHEVFVLSGEGVVNSKEGAQPVGEGTVVYVEPEEEHCFVNTGGDILRFICVVPAGIS